LNIDTDSLGLATTESIPIVGQSRLEQMENIFFPIVIPQKIDQFKAEWQNWLVLSNTIEEEKTPGKLKPEFLSQKCEMIALSPKNYMASCLLSNTTKTAMKGIPKWQEVTMENFRETLYDDTRQNVVEVRSLRLNKDRQMTRTTLLKRGLSSIHVKLRVNEDRIDCSPLQYPDGSYV